jgi:hypothetical protein
MKKPLDAAIGVLGSFVFLCAGVAILVWDTGKLRHAHDSAEWPQVEGIVNQSFVDTRQKEHVPHVEYAYAVAGTRFAFNLFYRAMCSLDHLCRGSWNLSRQARPGPPVPTVVLGM